MDSIDFNLSFAFSAIHYDALICICNLIDILKKKQPGINMKKESTTRFSTACFSAFHSFQWTCMFSTHNYMYEFIIVDYYASIRFNRTD